MYLNTIATAWVSCLLRLTLTWDVFKFWSLKCYQHRQNRLTLTWDVFKLQIFLSS